MRRQRVLGPGPVRGLGAAPEAGPNDINGGWLDRYTIAHVATGTLLRLLGKKKIPWWGALLLATSWELLEHPLKDLWPSLFAPYDTQDTIPNSLTDIAAVMLGYGLVAAIDEKDEAWIPT